MTLLTVPVAELRRLAGVDAGDTSQDAALLAVQAAEQPAHEYGLDPDALASAGGDAGLRAVLTLGVAQLLAGSYLQQTARAAGATDDVALGPLQITLSRTHNPAQLGDLLAGQGAARLSPYVRRGASAMPLAATFGLRDTAASGSLDPATVPGSDDGDSGASAQNTREPSLFDAPASDPPRELRESDGADSGEGGRP